MEPWTLVPGDRVRFDGQTWEVLVTGREDQRDDSPIWIFRYEHLRIANDVIDLLRQRGELTLIPRSPEVVVP